jgi:hypothetical protein
MKCKEGFGSEIAYATGTVMMVSWVVILGPMGALLLGGIAYSMLAKDLAMGVLCGAVFFLPIVLTAAWGSMRLSELLRERRLQLIARDNISSSFRDMGTRFPSSEATGQDGMPVKVAE